MRSEFSERFKENIDTLGMPDFRKLAMGLQAQIDALGTSTGGSLPSQTGNNGKYLTTNGTDASWGSIAGGGDVVGPAAAVDSNFASYNTTTGKLIKDSGSKASDFATSGHNHAGVYAPVLGADDNYVTDAEKTVIGNTSGTNTGDQILVKYPTLTVGASGCDYTTIQGALDAAAATYPQGARIFLVDSVYTISSTLLVKSNNVVIEGNYRGTELDVDGSSVTTVIKTNAPASLYQGLQLKNLSFIQTNGTAQGVCIDASDMAICWYDNLIVYNFGTGIKFLDTQNITFYNKVTNLLFTSIKDVCIDIDSHTGNSVNNNMFKDIRCSYGANGIGVRLDKAQLNTFYSCNFEPTSTTGTVGIQVKATTADSTINNAFYSPYVEANATGISLAANTHRTQFYGGQVVENTANLSDSGTNSFFAGIDIGYAQYNTFPKLSVADDAYGAGWNGSIEVPTKNAVYDKIQGLVSGTNTGDQTITNTSDGTSHTVTLSASGGSVQLVEGSNITLTTTGTGAAGIVTIAATSGGSASYVHLVQYGGII